MKRDVNSKTTTPPTTFLQPTSGILLTPNEDYLLTVNFGEGLLIKDATTLNSLRVLLSGQGAPFKIATILGEIIYVLDSVNNDLIVIDWKTKEIKKKVVLPNTPIAIALSYNGKRAYISHRSTLNKETITVIDLIDNKIIRAISTVDCALGIILSNNGRYLFASSECSGVNETLSVIDIKTDKLIKSIPGIAGGDAIGITPDNKKIYISNSLNSTNKINVVDASSFRIVSSLNFKATSFTFTLDGKYVFALGASEIIIINTENNQIVNRLPFVTTPRGLAVSKDGTAFVWLPQENRIFAFEVSKYSANKSGFDLESKLDKFKEDLKKKGINTDLLKLKGVFARVNEEFHSTVDSLKNELGQDFSNYQGRIRIISVADSIGYSYNGDGIGYDYRNLIYHDTYGIFYVYDRSKTIGPFFTIKLKVDNLPISIKADHNSVTEETFEAPLSNIDWKELRKFVRNYFLVRIDLLK